MPLRVSEEAAGPGFSARFATVRAERGPFCLGLDPTAELLQAWGLTQDVEGLRRFCDTVLQAAGRDVSVLKPQAAYFERFGPPGLQVLCDAVERITAAGSLALLDVKRGDIGSTNEAYARAWIGADSPMRGDAITLHAYLGFAALKPFLTRAQACGAGLFVVVLSSNPEGEPIQRAQVQSGLSVAEHLSDEITRLNQTLRGADPIGPVGAVVGLTAEHAPQIAARLPHSLLLVPGLGAQGGSFAQLKQRFGQASSRALPNASRSVLARGPSVTALRTSILEHCEAAARALS